MFKTQYPSLKVAHSSWNLLFLWGMLLSAFMVAEVVVADDCQTYRQLYQCPGSVKYPIHLSFDDGPSDRTLSILNTLKEENIPATFFVMASKVDCDVLAKQCSGAKQPCIEYQQCLHRRDILRQIKQSGYLIGSHSYDHIHHSNLPANDLYDQIVRSKQVLAEFLNTNPPLFRLPYGDGWFNRFDKPHVLPILENQGFKHVEWEMSAYDWRVADQQGDRMLRTVMNEICTKKRGVILFHDGVHDQPHRGRDFTADNLPKWIPVMRCVADFRPLHEFRDYLSP